jgi:SNF2 family DNA or RNA helicase
MENLESLIERGEKVLVFSQFTSFLSIIKTQLNEKNIDFAYLDGKTRNREREVNQFKTDPKKSVFLISLKAGGVGLNLTEASYCFLIDPWWNPAVESQAIDRIHRIGQEKKVFAYRLITKGSIEEKIIKLQQNKRDISKNILATDESLLKQMNSEDLKFLFS